MIKITAILVALIALSLLLTEGAAASNNRLVEQEQCKDRPHVHCHLIAEDGDCEMFTRDGESYGDLVCRVSCGRCNAKTDEISTDQLCYPFAKQVIEVSFSNRYVAYR